MEMNRSRKGISIVIPVFNEKEVLSVLINRIATVKANMLETYDIELIFVDDGSSDPSLSIIREAMKTDPSIQVICFSRNFGHQNAVMAGIDEARGDAVIIMDADLQDPPEIIPEMVNRWENGYQVVTATRKLRRGESLFKRITAWIFYRLMRWLSDTPVEVNVGDFRLADRRVIDVIKQLKEQSLYLRGIFNWVGFRQTTVGYTRDPRYAGETKYSVKKMTGLAFDALISFSEKPLYMVLRVGATTTICAMVMFSYLLSTTIFNIGYRAPGWMSLVAILLLLGSVQLICLGIIGLYIGRIYRESKNRPRYIIDSEK